MDFLLLTARVLHIGLGVFWAGTAIFIAAYLNPAMTAAGPDAGKVGAGLIQRGFLNAFPASAVLTVLSGLFLLRRASAGTIGYMGSAPGMAYSTGMLAAIGALFVGLTRIRPSLLKAAALHATAAAAAPADRDRIMGEIQLLRVRAASGGRAVAWMVGITVVTMAVGRYL